jgi:hypothetical protein
MVIIAHRGNLEGPKPEKENHPDYILEAHNKGYEVEVDVWYTAGNWYLGHDKPQYEIKSDFLYLQGLWLHAKNIDALYQLGSGYRKNNFFWHQSDDFTLTSNGVIWTYPGKELTDRSVIVMPHRLEKGKRYPRDVYGICTDFALEAKVLSIIFK